MMSRIRESCQSDLIIHLYPAVDSWNPANQRKDVWKPRNSRINDQPQLITQGYRGTHEFTYVSLSQVAVLHSVILMVQDMTEKLLDFHER